MHKPSTSTSTTPFIYGGSVISETTKNMVLIAFTLIPGHASDPCYKRFSAPPPITATITPQKKLGAAHYHYLLQHY